MANYAIVDRTQLDSAVMETANAIREKMGSSDPLIWDPEIGFQTGVNAIQTGSDSDGATALVERSATEIINNKAKHIGYAAFRNNGTILKLAVNNAEYVDQYGVYSCTALRELYLPKATELRTDAANGCTRMHTLDISSAETIGTNAFRNCWALTKVELPKATSIAAGVFYGCKALTQLILDGNDICTLADVSALEGTPIASGTGYIYVPDVSVPAYQVATNWSAYEAQIKGLSEVPA